MKRIAITAMTGLLCLDASAVQLNEMIQVHKSDGTYFKASTAQSSTLPDSQKCLLGDKDIMQYVTLASAEGNHYKITLPRTYPGCGLKEGYLYRDHVSTYLDAFSVFTPTLFKRSTADSGSLPAADKCDLPVGFYKATETPDLADGHYQLKLAQAPAGCSFSTGYVSSVHSVRGTRGITLRSSAWLKKSTANSSTLPDSDKCLVPAGDYVREGFLDDKDNHYWMSFANTPPGCSFKQGYVYYYNITFEEPDAAGTVSGTYTWPQPNSSLGSAWCVCRSRGTSPHIGQDFVSSVAKTAVAIQDGEIISSTFSSSCGYKVQLEDNAGGIWRYVHLNKPLFGVGDRVKQGQKLANISAYPTSSCGSGPHLHFERRSAGAFNDSPTGKSCQNGFRTCHYDPIKPWRTSSAVAKNEPVFTDSKVAGSMTFEQPEKPQIKLGNNPVALPDSHKIERQSGVCKVNPNRYPLDSAKRVAAFSELGSEQFTVSAALVNQSGQNVLDLAAHLKGNRQNLCTKEQGGDCIVSWSVVGQKADNRLVRLFHDASVSNEPVARVAAESFCLPEDVNHQLTFLFTLASGKQVKVEQNLQ